MISKNSLEKKPKRKYGKQKFNIDVESLLWLPGNVAVFWKNKEGCYLGCNDVAAKSIRLNSRHDIVDKSNFDLLLHQEEARLMQEGDMKVMNTRQPMQFNYIYTNTDKKIELLSFKAPLYDENGKIAGVYGIDHFLTIHDVDKLIYALTDLPINKKHIKKNHTKCNVSELLTKRQCECLYLLVRGKTMKQIANELNISSKTVEHYLDAIKIKLNCYSRSELIEKALQLQFIKDKLT